MFSARTKDKQELETLFNLYDTKASGLSSFDEISDVLQQVLGEIEAEEVIEKMLDQPESGRNQKNYRWS